MKLYKVAILFLFLSGCKFSNEVIIQQYNQCKNAGLVPVQDKNDGSITCTLPEKSNQ